MLIIRCAHAWAAYVRACAHVYARDNDVLPPPPAQKPLLWKPKTGKVLAISQPAAKSAVALKTAAATSGAGAAGAAPAPARAGAGAAGAAAPAPARAGAPARASIQAASKAAFLGGNARKATAAAAAKRDKENAQWAARVAAAM